MSGRTTGMRVRPGTDNLCYQNANYVSASSEPDAEGGGGSDAINPETVAEYYAHWTRTALMIAGIAFVALLLFAFADV